MNHSLVKWTKDFLDLCIHNNLLEADPATRLIYGLNQDLEKTIPQVLPSFEKILEVSKSIYPLLKERESKKLELSSTCLSEMWKLSLVTIRTIDMVKLIHAQRRVSEENRLKAMADEKTSKENRLQEVTAEAWQLKKELGVNLSLEVDVGKVLG